MLEGLVMALEAFLLQPTFLDHPIQVESRRPELLLQPPPALLAELFPLLLPQGVANLAAGAARGGKPQPLLVGNLLGRSQNCNTIPGL